MGDAFWTQLPVAAAAIGLTLAGCGKEARPPRDAGTATDAADADGDVYDVAGDSGAADTAGAADTNDVSAESDPTDTVTEVGRDAALDATSDVEDAAPVDPRDPDRDGLTNSEERSRGTNPDDPDTDLDQVDDGADLEPLDAAVGLASPVVDGFVRLRVIHTPLSTPDDAVIHVAGTFTGWEHAPMTREADGTWSYLVALSATSTESTYKFTLGDWSSEEGDYRGPDNNRVLEPRRIASVQTHVIRRWRDEAAPAGTATGTIVTIDRFASVALGRDTTVRIYLPPDYNHTARLYPVLYMQDGQNLFDIATATFGVEWEIDETLDRLFHEGGFSGAIVVGVDNGNERSCEYSPFADATGCEGRPGRLAAYSTFLTDELKPAIDAEYRTMPGREHTGAAGSSRGGLAALWMGVTAQETFGRVAGLSATMLEAIVGGSMVEVVAAEGRRAPMRIYLDYGDSEVVYGHDAPELIGAMDEVLDALSGAGFAESEVRREVIGGAIHNEADWARRFAAVAKWIFGAR